MNQVRAIFLSDVHLGTAGCQAERLLGFLRDYEAQRIYLVGDVIDLWAMRSVVAWPPAQNTVVQKLLKRARHGVEVIFVPGNHDEPLREHVGLQFGNVRLFQEAVHETFGGQRLLVVHGDEFDPATRYSRWFALIGDHGYEWMMWVQRNIARLRRRLGLASHFSLAALIRTHLASARRYVEDFEQAAVRHARELGYDGIVCGHIHHPARRQINGMHYLNCGDWIDSCSALVEHLDGRWELVRRQSGDLDTDHALATSNA